MSELAKLWTGGDLAKEYPDHVRVKKSSGDDARIFAWLANVRLHDGSTFGDRVVASITLDDCNHVIRALPKTAEAPSTRRQYARAFRKLVQYAVYPLRLLAPQPIAKSSLPKGGTDKAKAWIYPSEDLALMKCVDVSLALSRRGASFGEKRPRRSPTSFLARFSATDGRSRSDLARGSPSPA